MASAKARQIQNRAIIDSGSGKRLRKKQRPDCNDWDSRFTARVIVQTSARSFSTKHYDDDAKNRNSPGT